MKIVKLEKNSPTLDGEVMPLSFYAGLFLLLEDNDNNIAIRYKNNAYWFDKKYIERFI